MPILHQIQKIYDTQLLPYRFEIDVIKGVNTVKRKIKKYKSGKERYFKYEMETLKFEFKEENLKHLLGIHKIKPYNNHTRYSAKLIYNQIKNKSLLYSHITKQNKSDEVSIRSIHFLELSYLLNHLITDKIYYFDAKKYKGNTQIKSQYIIYNDKGNFALYFGLAIDAQKGYIYPETWFIREMNKDDIISNQQCYNIAAIRQIKI